ncbi:MAG: PEP-utilizing enzyme [Planctomycetes bacterium]|jgi:phosphohistidine swiveling domain-containing protein|nr:PEP-utilizing enzyme [Planctomycetota bacterium]
MLKSLGDRHKMYIYPWYISDLVATSEIKKLFGYKIKSAFMIFDQDFVKFYYDFESTNKLGEVVLKKIIKDRGFYQKVLKKIYFYSEQLENFGQEVKKIKVSTLKDRELIKIFNNYLNKIKILRLWGWTPVILDGVFEQFLSNYLQEQLREYLLKIGLESKTNEYYSLLSSSEKPSDVQKEELSRLEVLLNKKSITQHLKDFSWLTYSYSGPAMSKEYLLESLTASRKNGDPKKQQEKIKQYYLEIKDKKQTIIQNIKLPKELIYLFSVAAEFMFIKDYRKGIYQRSYLIMDTVLLEMAKRLGISLKEIKYLLFTEIKEALLNNKKEHYQKILKLRTQKCCYFINNEKIKVYQGLAVDKLKSKLIKTEAKAGIIKELKGMVAYPGKVRGKVKIVLVVEDVSKIKENEILVSSSTNPDLILAMKKAAGFITDFGGIISHAAIVAREMKKPCVTGTKIATSVLHDGDEVELDANNGLVRILSRK